jgi:hypothetical protein
MDAAQETHREHGPFVEPSKRFDSVWRLRSVHGTKELGLTTQNALRRLRNRLRRPLPVFLPFPRSRQQMKLDAVMDRLLRPTRSASEWMTTPEPAMRQQTVSGL